MLFKKPIVIDVIQKAVRDIGKAELSSIGIKMALLVVPIPLDDDASVVFVESEDIGNEGVPASFPLGFDANCDGELPSHCSVVGVD
jgi:hypothetical protein